MWAALITSRDGPDAVRVREVPEPRPPRAASWSTCTAPGSPVGGDRFPDSLRCLAREGRLLVLGFTGRAIPTVGVDRLLPANTTVVGVASAELWRAEPEYPRQQWRDLEPLLRSGAVDPPIGAVHPLADTAEAIRSLDERRAVGRVLVRVRD